MTAAVLATFLAWSSQNDRSPKGDTILRGPYGELVSVGLDDVPPEAPAGCLPLFTLAPGYVPTWAAPEGQPSLADRAQHVACLRCGSPFWSTDVTAIRLCHGCKQPTDRRAGVARGGAG